MNPGQSLTEAELDELGNFLLSEEMPEECMDISTLDGFLAAIVLNPDLIMPSQWLAPCCRFGVTRRKLVATIHARAAPVRSSRNVAGWKRCTEQCRKLRSRLINARRIDTLDFFVVLDNN